MNVKSIFFPQRFLFPDSKFNKNISVFQYLFSTTLLVDGLIESGDIMTRVWEKGIKSHLPKTFQPKKVLLLGLAGGCNARLINRYFPSAKITAVEIDPFMIKLGEKFFGLRKIKNLKIIIGDALEFVNKLQHNNVFDLVMVDCFVGKEIPKKLENLEFFQKLKRHSRFVLINRLWWRSYKEVTSNFFRHLSSRFFFTKAHIGSNIVISLV